MKISRLNTTAIAMAIAVTSLVTASPTTAAPSERCSALLNYSLTAYRTYSLTRWSAIFNWGMGASAQRRQEC